MDTTAATTTTETDENIPLTQQTLSTSIENTTNTPRHKNIGGRKRKRIKSDARSKKSTKAKSSTKRIKNNRNNRKLTQPLGVHTNTPTIQENNPDETNEPNINKSATVTVVPDPTDETLDENIKTVSCSICKSDSIRVPDEHLDDIDFFLSMHMQSCTGEALIQPQRNRSTLRSSSRRSRKQVNYKDFDDEDEDIIDGVIDDQKDTNINVVGSDDNQKGENTNIDDESSSKSNQINESDNDDNCDDNCDDDGNDSIFEDDIDPNAANEITSSSSVSSEPEYVRENAIDDFDEDDYEDRVDDWIVNGIQKMKKMNEQDATEKKPGSVTFPGGLEVPAWVNDRLFGYQRTALRWMWELHLQGAGGIVGDEMGLGVYYSLTFYVNCDSI